MSVENAISKMTSLKEKITELKDCSDKRKTTTEK